jgi:S1-C subfamily serine protease
VTEVGAGSPPQTAGMRSGEVITSVNGQPVKSNSALRNPLGLMRIGDKIEIGLLRDGKPQHLTATIAEPAGEAVRASGH